MQKHMICAILIAALSLSVWTNAENSPVRPNCAAQETNISHEMEIEFDVQLFDQAETDAVARMLWGEARGLSKTEQAAVVWCLCNGIDAWGGDVISAVTMPGRFYGYRAENPLDPALVALAEDVLSRWALEKAGVADVGRVLPKEYLYFSGDGEHNYFRIGFYDRTYWDWSLPSPYKT